MSPTGRIVVVGLGPGGHEHVTTEAIARIARVEHRFLRTSRHPSADLVPGAVSFDEIYEAADRFEAVYAEIVERLVAAAAEHGEVLYAVPGSPLVLERSVARLRGRRPCRRRGACRRCRSSTSPGRGSVSIRVEAGVRLVDGHEFASAAAGQAGPLLVAHTHANWVLSEIKLAADELDPRHRGRRS